LWINLKTEFTFGAVYGHIDKVVNHCSKVADSSGICDFGNTFGHIRWQKVCKKAGVKPIYGVVLPVVEDLNLKIRRYAFNNMSFIAKNSDGLKELYALVDQAHKQFYYRQRLSYDQLNKITDNIIILSGLAPRVDLIKRDIFFELSPATPFSQRSNNDFPAIACIDNNYINNSDVAIYEPFADLRKRERKTTPQHILSYAEWLAEFPRRTDALSNLKAILDVCDATLHHAPMVKYIGKDCIEDWSEKGAKLHGIDIKNPGPYKDRYENEMKLIKEKDYVDYFLVTADLIRYAKTKMAVGPARGSSAGSLVCYLMGITEIDPLEYDLYFERFIDINRFDLPDIDVDFQDEKRHLVMNYLKRKYGADNVAQIGNVNRLKPKSAITRFAKALGVPLDDVEELKDSMMERSGGDARANMLMEDTFADSDVGRRFIEKYPNMESVRHIEAHASHTGVHAAGIIVCNAPITNYCGINSRDNKRIGMLDKKDAEDVNLLKIDALGLRTLSIIASVCDQIGKKYEWMYEIPTDDEETFKVFNDQRFNGIFQFEGPAVKGLARQMPIENMEDIAALSALGRPGPLSSGGANSYIKFRSGKESVKYVNDHPIVVSATKSTYGVIVYQEQVMKIVRELGQLSWEKTSAIRKAMSKTLGVEFFDKMYAEFEIGALENGLSAEESKTIWDHINTMGSWSFNKSHAVSYGLVSYLCGYMKAHYPLEFVVACLNHSKSDQSALKILRDAVENDGVEYKYIDTNLSERDWSVKGGTLYGGLTTIHGIGPAMANKVVKFRKEGKTLPTGIQNKLNAGISTFKYLYPGKQLYGDYYTHPETHGLNGCVSKISDCVGDGLYTVIGCLIKKNTRDANEACFVGKRNGEYMTGQTTWINITIEDDTDSVMAKIQTKDYIQMGKEIAETGKENKDWYMIHGSKINGWNLLFVRNIRKITREL